ncbi:MAG: hypothetical protein RBJ76_00775 [Stenomitos frigidus ULC029]
MALNSAPAGADNADADKPSLSKVLEQNIRTLAYLRLQASRSRGVQD